jgi:molybdopterin synthase sulfur carrier subunit
VPKVILRTFGQLTSFTRCHELDMEFQGRTVHDFLLEAEMKLGKEIRQILYPDGKSLSPFIYILINGKNVEHMSGLQTEIRDGDVVSVLPVTAG